MTEQLKDEVARAILPGFDNAAEFVRDCALQTADVAIAIVLERCAQVAEGCQEINRAVTNEVANRIAKRIRALQEQTCGR